LSRAHLTVEGDDVIGEYEELPFALERTAGIDILHLAKARHYVPVLLEIDVTDARAAIRRHRQQGEDLSFTAWAVRCVAQAASEHRRVHAVRHGRRRYVVFADVDVSLAVYRRLTDESMDERLPMPFVVRKANAKSVGEISADVRRAQTTTLAPGEQWIAPDGMAPPTWLLPLAFRAPRRLRRWLYWDRLLRSPWRIKTTMGTVVVTSVPIASKSGGGGWGIPITIHPLAVALGAVGRRAGPAGSAEPREMLSLTVMFDHDVVDGVPVALFLRRLLELMEGAFGLERGDGLTD
jgi:pyruvate/2-oxoglutarate dehydrogenase complex dihydrolipoamide acyltransferase (E2) component